ncbi:hypothetical protein AX14_006376 [Amanita brunnescens Koide BX004]|nr:hypothetical protein AX14_006376 [Amanita brunnescens Koide BX004]
MGRNSPPSPNPPSQALPERDYGCSARLDGQVTSSATLSPPFQAPVLAQAPLAPQKYGKKRPPQGPPTAPAWINFLPQSSDDKAIIAIDTIDNEHPDKSSLLFDFLKSAVYKLQDNVSKASTAVQQRNRTIDELRTLCNSLETRLAALSAAPTLSPSPSATASASASVAAHSVGHLPKSPNISTPQGPAQAAMSAKLGCPTPPIALSALPSDTSAGAALVLVPTPPDALSARPSGASAGSLPSLRGSTSPVALLTPPPSVSTGNAPATTFRGRHGMKPSELHIQFKSRAEFNTKLMRFFDNNTISHRHSLLNALISAVCTRIDEESSLLFSGNRLRAAFWTPRGNLLIRFLKAPSPSLLAFMLDTLEMVCGAKDFVILNCPAVSAFKLSNVPTHARNGSPTDLNQLALGLLDHPQLRNVAFWHTPRFVSFKGAPIGQRATLFFSVADSPSYELGRAIIGSHVNIGNFQFTVEKWHHTKLAQDHAMPIGRHSMFKENTGLLSPAKAHHNMPRERFIMLNEFRCNHVSPPPLARGDALNY